MNKRYAAMFSPFWNEIVKSLREEDYINNRELDLLSIPSNTGSLRLIQWPLFLLSSKVCLVKRPPCTYDTEGRLWVERIFREINNSLLEGSFLMTLIFSKLSLVMSRFAALTGLLMQNESPELAKGAVEAMNDLYEVVRCRLI